MPNAKADVKLPSIFSDHMVIQRGMKVPVWGMAAADENVTVAFKGQIKTTTADKEGKWRVQLDPLEAGGPEQITISGMNSVTIRDVLIGDVWVGSGQSNMAGGTGGYARRDEELAKLKAAAP